MIYNFVFPEANLKYVMNHFFFFRFMWPCIVNMG